MDPTALSFRIADIYLKDLLKAESDKQAFDDKPEVAVNPKILDAYVGDYELEPGFIISFSKDHDHLVARPTGQPSFPMYAVSNTAFRLKVVPAEVVFDDVTQGGTAQNAVLHQYGANFPLKRITITTPATDRLKAYEGHYYSAELGVFYDVFVRKNVLMVHYPRGELDLQPVGVDAFTTGFPIQNLKFTCTDDGRCNVLSINDGRVKELRFDRISLDPIGSKSLQ